MKLPEYRNDKPLYSEQESGWDDIKFPAMAIGLPLLLLCAFGVVLYAIFG